MFAIASLVVFILDWLESTGVIQSGSKFLSFDSLTSLGLVLLVLAVVVGGPVWPWKR